MAGLQVTITVDSEATSSGISLDCKQQYRKEGSFTTEAHYRESLVEASHTDRHLPMHVLMHIHRLAAGHCWLSLMVCVGRICSTCASTVAIRSSPCARIHPFSRCLSPLCAVTCIDSEAAPPSVLSAGSLLTFCRQAQTQTAADLPGDTRSFVLSVSANDGCLITGFEAALMEVSIP